MLARTSLVTLFALLTVFLTGQVAAAPVPMPLKVAMRELEERTSEPLKTIPVYKRQIPVEQAVTAPDGVVRVFGTREEEIARRQIPAEQAVTAPNGVVRPFGTREE
ncbi:hypothetical protein NLJ89_g10759 [Agrocybe chaxingu]|uniref:Uncharacterized protein n=1 Tax=Agrocybe chaxingu TaxID=84603 RepID=A0A9W8JQ41_9AGAR|nr:hypothetical protein NLJ89_g10759 [Agrocybe chaxingu]